MGFGLNAEGEEDFIDASGGSRLHLQSSPLLLSLRELAYTLSDFVNLYLVYLFYAISLYGLYKALGESLSSTS